MKLTLLVLLFPLSAAAGDLPDPMLTPGAVDPSVTQANIHETVCVKGYTKTVRPPAYYTNKLKKSQIRQYGFEDMNPKHYEEDHLIALALGGSPDDRKNLWPQTKLSAWNADKKDDLEFAMYKMVCAGQLSLDTARNEMAANWIQAYKKYMK